MSQKISDNKKDWKKLIMLNVHGQNYLIRTSIVCVLFLINVLYFCITARSAVSFEMLGSQKNFDQLNPFKEKIVHFDLKGAPPTLKYYKKIFPLLKKMKVDGILMEYEDMFPYWNELTVLKRTIAYSKTILKAILELASNNNLEVIPLVQTFGHMEFVLKHSKYSIYREDIFKHDTICPSDEGSWHLITEMLTQIRIMHPNAKRIHIGADEVYTIGQDFRCINRRMESLSFTMDHLKLDHISRVARYARSELNFAEVLVWNDMFSDIEIDLLNQYEMGELVTPVIWGYAVNVTKLNYFPINMFKRYSQVFPKMMFASAFKGANGQNESFCYIRRYLANQQSYVELYEKEKQDLNGKISGIILTGWQRYNHYSPLCEILPVSIPSLIVDLDILNCRSITTHNTVKSIGTVWEPEKMDNDISLEMMFVNCSFPGSKIYDEVLNFHSYITDEKQLTVDLEKIRENIAFLLRPYFYDESINEIITEQLS
ncbi:Glycosyl hydrolase 20 catalytic domain family protein [Brugia pahangi]